MPTETPLLLPSMVSTSAASLLLDNNGDSHRSQATKSCTTAVRVEFAPVKKSAFRYSEPPADDRAIRIKSERRDLLPLPSLVGTMALESTSKPTIIKAEAEPTESTRTTTATSPRKLATADQKGKEKVATSHQEQDLPTKSLLRSLHGPSAGKAGLIRDPEETRQIIYEASKGSKYFQAQQQRDLDLTVRVDKLVAYLDKLVKERGGNVRAEEDRVDEMLKEMEKERVLTETVAVVDADAFYASCHQREDPSLAGKPFGVGKGVLTTASYEARKYGCSSAMAGFVAKKLCPELIFVPLDFKLYVEASKTIMDVLRQYGETSPASLDEAYISLTDYCRREQVTPAVASERMRAQVFAETRLTVSAGISPNAMLSKVAADKNKPDGQCVIDPTREAVMQFTSGLPVRKIPGIGRVSERLLQAVGIETVADVFRERGKLFLIRNQIGLTFLLRAYLGLGRTEIKQAERSSRKGISVERTFQAVSEVQGFYDRLKLISEGLAADCEKTEYSGRTLTLKLKTHTFRSISRSKTLGSAIYFSDAATFYAEGKKMLDKEIAERKALIARGGVPRGGKDFSLRLIGLRLSNLRDEQLTKAKGGKLDGWAGTKINKKQQQVDSTSAFSKEEGEPDHFDIDALCGFDEDAPGERDDGDGEDGKDSLASGLEDQRDDFDDAGTSHHVDLDSVPDIDADSELKPPASSDPLWAALGPFDDEVLRSIELDGLDDFEATGGKSAAGAGPAAAAEADAKFYNSMDRPMEYKPFFTAGESLNSRKEWAPPAPLKDRLSFEHKGRIEVDEKSRLGCQEGSKSEPTTEIGGNANQPSSGGGPGLLTCPVCTKAFVGSELALSAHVAAHFDNNHDDVSGTETTKSKKPKKKKIKTEHSGSSSGVDASKPGSSSKNPAAAKSKNSGKGKSKGAGSGSIRSGRVDSFFRPAPM